MTRTFKQAICRLLIGLVLFAQMAVAAYACPAMSMAAAAESADCATMAMADASQERAERPTALEDKFDAGAPNLCAAHCHFGQQTSDEATTLAVPPLALVDSLYAVPVLATKLEGVRPDAEAPDRFAAAFPPHSILHCCFRI